MVADVTLVVKHTFLEFVERDAARCRALTDTALLESDGEGRHDGETPIQCAVSNPAYTGQMLPVEERAAESDVDEALKVENEQATKEVKAVLGLLPQAVRGPETGRKEERRFGGSVTSTECCLAASVGGSGRRYSAPSTIQQAGRLGDGATDEGSQTTGCIATARSVDDSSSSSSGGSDEWRTTVMLRNLPNNYTRDMLIELVDSLGFSGAYDLIYFPVDFSTGAGLGYAFVNLCTAKHALSLWSCLEGFSRWTLPSQKVCTVTWSHPHQGLASHVERYRNSPVMHPSVPDHWKPALYQNGARATFPAPTKKLKMPRTKRLDLVA